jgi:hypothetical protein
LQTGDKSRTAMMTFARGQSSGDKETHRNGAQELLTMEGELA